MRGIGDHDAVERVITMAWRTHDARGFMTVLRFAALYWRFRDSFLPAKPPKFVLDTILGLLYPISRLCGYPNAYPKYEGGGTP